MTTDEFDKNSGVYILISLLKKVYNARFFIILAAIIGFILSIVYLKYYRLPTEEKNQQYIARGYLDSYVTNDQVIQSILTSINAMDPSTKAKKLNIPVKLSSNLLTVNGLIINVEKEPESPIQKAMIGYEIAFTDKKSFDPIFNGIMHYINSHEYIKKEIEEYKKQRKLKSELLDVINQEVKRIDFQNKKLTNLSDPSTKSNSDLFTLKLKLEHELLTTEYSVYDIYPGYPQAIEAPKNIHSAIVLTLSTLISAFMGFVCFSGIQLISIIRKNYTTIQ